MSHESSEYSASVALHFEVEGQVLTVAQVGDRSLLLRSPADIAPDSLGRIIVTVDGEDRIYPVIINEVLGREVRFEQVKSADLAGFPF